MRDGTGGEFSAIRSYPNVEVHHMPTARDMTVLLTYCGKDVGVKHTVYTRKGSNKVQSETFQVDGEFLDLIRNHGDIETWRLK